MKKVKEKLEDAGDMNEDINRPETVREYFDHPDRFKKVKEVKEGAITLKLLKRR